MKKIFKFALLAFAAAAVVAACQPTVNPDDDEDPVAEYTGPTEGTSAWSLIGAVLEKSWDTDWVLAQSGDIYVIKNVKLVATDEFKVRKDKDWAVNFGGNYETLGQGFFVTQDGPNVKPGLDGFYDIYLNLGAGNQMAVCEKDAQPTWQDPAKINIDGDFSDWDGIEGVSEGTYGMFKVTSDKNNIYFYSWRTTDGRFSDIWGGAGYIYIAFELDGDETTGETLWGNGPYEIVGAVYPYAGTADAPVIAFNKGECLPVACTFENIVVAGVVDEEGAKVEFAISRDDLIDIPATEITVWSWGNKDLAKVSIDVTL